LTIQRDPVRAKTRTREHIIADMSFNYLESWVLQCGYVVEPIRNDYGYDAYLHTFDENGELEPGRVLLQIKATNHLKVLKDGKTVSAAVDRRDLKVWLREPAPVIFVVYDAVGRRAFWLNVQEYFKRVRTKDLFSKSGNLSVRIPMSNRINQRAIRQFARLRDACLPKEKEP
jgi:hypothetical protein